MAGHLAFNDLVRSTGTRNTSVNGDATRTALGGEGQDNAATRPLGRTAAWTVEGGAAGGSVFLRFYGGPASRPVRVIAALGLQVPVGCTAIIARVLNGSTSTTGAAPPTLTAAEFARPLDPTQKWNVVWTLDSGITGDGCRLEFQLAAGSTGTLRVGRVWASESLRLASGVDSDWTVTVEDTSLITYAPASRSPSVHGGVAYRRIQAPLQLLDEAQALGTNGAADQVPNNILSIARHLGRGRECLLIPRDSSALYRQALPVYGLIERPVSLGHRAGPYYASDLEVAEII